MESVADLVWNAQIFLPGVRRAWHLKLFFRAYQKGLKYDRLKRLIAESRQIPALLLRHIQPPPKSSKTKPSPAKSLSSAVILMPQIIVSCVSSPSLIAAKAGAGAGVRSCAHWLQWQCGISLGPAREKVRVARRLEQLPRIAAAFSLGKLSYSMVRALTRQADPDTEDYYLYIARNGTVSHIEKLVRKHDYVEKLQMAGREAAQYESRSFDCYRDDDGMWVIRAKLPPAEGALLVKALDAIQDRCDPSVVPRGLAGEHCGPAGENNTGIKTFGQKRADALNSLAEHYLATAQEGPEALKGAERNQVMLHVDLKTLQENSGENHCRLDHDNWLHPDSARRLSCDASLVTVLENEKGEVLNIGRRARIIPPHIQRALQTRDHGQCQYPGFMWRAGLCGVPSLPLGFN